MTAVEVTLVDYTLPKRGNDLAPIAGEIVYTPALPCHICAGTERPCPTCACVVCGVRWEDEEADGLCAECRAEFEQKRWDEVHGHGARYER